MRTFIAVEIAPAVRRRAEELIGLLRSSRADVKWVEPRNLHLTLKFLGEVSPKQLTDVAKVLAEVAAAQSPFDFELQGTGAFPSIDRPRTIWLGVADGRETLSALAGQIERALAPLGFAPEDRPFSAHLTIGRVRNPGPTLRELSESLRQQAAWSTGRSRVEQVVVFSSELTPRGPIYTAVSEAKLA